MKEYEQNEKPKSEAEEPEVDYLASPIIDEDDFDTDNEA